MCAGAVGDMGSCGSGEEDSNLKIFSATTENLYFANSFSDKMSTS